MNINKAQARVLIYEGIPGSGKTSLRYAYGKLTQFVDLTIDRFTPTQWVFSQLRNDLIVQDLSEIEQALDNILNVVVIWCQCPIEKAFQRCRQKRDFIDSSIDNLIKLEQLYKEYFSTKCKFSKIIELDTNRSLDNICLDLLKHFN